MRTVVANDSDISQLMQFAVSLNDVMVFIQKII